MQDLDILTTKHFQHCGCERKTHRPELQEWYADLGVAIENGVVSYRCPQCTLRTSIPLDDFVCRETVGGLLCHKCRQTTANPTPALD